MATLDRFRDDDDDDDDAWDETKKQNKKNITGLSVLQEDSRETRCGGGRLARAGEG